MSSPRSSRNCADPPNICPPCRGIGWPLANIEADGRIHKWKSDPLFIFDDTLIHQSFNEEDDLRFCAFIDIIRPSHFDNIIKLILKAVGLLLKNTRSVFYKNWKMI